MSVTQPKQRSNHILMVRPARFGYNTETAANNLFQNAEGAPEHVARQAQREFDAYVQLLRDNEVDVLVVQDSAHPHTPDSIFPNNWFSTHQNGVMVYYPMFAKNRQLERKRPILATLEELPGYDELIDLRHYEAEGKFLEGTGSLVLDRINKIAYACISDRTDRALLDEFCQLMNYKPVAFNAYDLGGAAIYHTNVMMCVAQEYAVICLECITDEAERNAVVVSLNSTGHEIIELSQAQLLEFAGNMLEVENERGQSLLLMSDRALKSLGALQKAKLESYSKIIAPDLCVIERNGGGSARCMVAELYLPTAE